MKQLTPVWILVGTVTLARLYLAGEIELAQDEAYYWMWGEQPAWGYFDHPPMIAWLIRIGTEILGDTERGVRLMCTLLGGGISLLCATATPAEERYRDQSLLIAVVLSFLPLFALGGLLATPDVPLCAAWALGIWAAARDRPALLGLAGGLAMLSKYTGVLLLPLVLLAEPHRLRERRTWMAIGIAAGVYAPNALWNMNRDGISWKFQLEHASAGGNSLDFLGAQAGLVSPLLFVVFVAWWWVGWKGERLERICWWSSVPLLSIALISGGEANWAAPAYVSTTVGLCCRAGRWRRATWATSVLAIGVSLIFLLHLVHPVLNVKGDPRARLEGGRTLGESVSAWGIPVVATSRYQEAGLISFYGGIHAVALPDHGRPDQFDIWETELPDHTLYIRVWDGDRPPVIESRGYHSRGANDVSAYMPTPDPNESILVSHWQVFEVVREESSP
jgi:4-amino-4-deoxy-L-arabinose transferase-like glycosyltransferase